MSHRTVKYLFCQAKLTVRLNKCMDVPLDRGKGEVVCSDYTQVTSIFNYSHCVVFFFDARGDFPYSPSTKSNVLSSSV